MYKDGLLIKTRVPGQKDSTLTGCYGFDGFSWKPVKLDPDGRVISAVQDSFGNQLLVKPDGTIAVHIADDFSTSANQALMIQHLNSIDLKLGDALYPDLNTVLGYLKQLRDLLQDSGISSSVILEQSRAVTNVGPAGTVLTVPWVSRSMVHRVSAIQEYGSSPGFRLEVANSLSFLQRDILFSYKPSPLTMPRLDLLETFPFVNKAGLPEIYLRVVADNGTSNQYFVTVSGTIAR